MKKIKIENQAVGPFPAMIVGAMMDEKPTFTTVGAGGCACLEPVLCVSLKNTHYITEGIIQTGYFSVNMASKFYGGLNRSGIRLRRLRDKMT